MTTHSKFQQLNSSIASDEYPLNFQEINSNAKDRLRLMKEDPNPIILLLDSMEDMRNLGSIFRLADACRLEGIYGFQMNTNQAVKKIDSVSRQTNKHIPFKRIETIDEVLVLSRSYYPIALEYTNKSIPFNQHQQSEPCMLIVGNERHGLSTELLEVSSTSLHVPMLGMNSSMNVSVATGIVLYQLLGSMGKI